MTATMAWLVSPTLLALLLGFFGQYPHKASSAQSAIHINGYDIAVDGSTNRAFVTGEGPNEDGHITVLDATSGTTLRRLTVGTYATPLVVDTPAGRVYTTSGPPSAIRVLDARTGATRAVWKAPVTGPLGISSRTRHVFALEPPQGSAHASVTVMLDERDGALLRTTRVGMDAAHIIVDDATERVFVLNVGSSTVSVLDARTGTVLRTTRVLSEPYALAVSVRLGRVYIVGGTNSVGLEMLDARTGYVLRTIGGPNVGGDGVAIDEQRGHVLLPAGWNLLMLDGRTGLTLHDTNLGAGHGIVGVPVVDEQGGRIYVELYSMPGRDYGDYGKGNVVVVDAVTGRVRRDMTVDDSVSKPLGAALALDPHSHRLFALTDHTITMFDTNHL